MVENRQDCQDQFYKLEDAESPLAESVEDITKSGTDPRRQTGQRNLSQFNHGQYNAKNKTTQQASRQNKPQKYLYMTQGSQQSAT